MIQIEQFTDTQAFHKNVRMDELADIVVDSLSNYFKKLAIQTRSVDYDILTNDGVAKIIKHKRKDSIASQNLNHNKVKQYLIPEDTIVKPLIDLGVLTADGKIVKSKYDKYKQINRFLEIINDAVKDIGDKRINIVDFGCGKSYLTFVLYHFLKEMQGYDISITGLDLKEDVISNCNLLAAKYGYDGLKFIAGDIKDYSPSGNVDIMICLHACDTATDYALYNAIRWGAKAIIAVPCCQHEINEQIQTDEYAILTRYGIVKERISALMTDAIRANLLELNDYEVQILEFVDLAHSPKNLLIRAIKKNITLDAKKRSSKEIDAILKEYNISPTLCKLLEYTSVPFAHSGKLV
jgi:SAM-dependent methyltransferase